MPYPNWLAGQRVTAGLMRGGQTFEVEQGADQTVTNSTVMVNSNLIIPVVASARYEYRLHLYAQGTTSEDFSHAWAVPAAASMVRTGIGMGQDNTVTSATRGNSTFAGRGAAGSPFSFGGVGAGVDEAFWETGVIIVGATAGVAQLQFAQRVAAATSAVLRDISRVFYQRVG